MTMRLGRPSPLAEPFDWSDMREFSRHECILIFRSLRVLQFILSGTDSAKCAELAEYFESMARLSEEEP